MPFYKTINNRKKNIVSDVHDWVDNISPSLFSQVDLEIESQLQKTINRKNCNIYFYSIGSSDFKKSYCIKQVLNLTNEKVKQLFVKGQGVYPILAQSGVFCTEFIDFDEQTNSIIMPTIEGECLENRIIKSFFQGDKSRLNCMNILTEMAKKAVILHTSSIPSSLPMPSPSSNSDYYHRLSGYLEEGLIKEALTVDGKSPKAIVDSFKDSFKQGKVNGLLHGDFQAKNVLINQQGCPSFIDLNFGLGHPLFDVAQFLTQLIRVSRIYNFARARKYLEEYGDHFLAMYFKHSPSHVEKDLPFFMFWSMAFSLLGDVGRSRLAKSYISSHIRASTMFRKWSSLHK